MLLSAIALLAGLALLVWSSDKFILGASSTAAGFGVSPLLIGLTIVGFGTSAPEMVVSALSAFNGNPGLAIGNALGSNIANIALILGISALVVPLAVSSRVLRNEMPVLFAVTLLVILVIWDLNLSRLDSWILIIAMFGVMGWLVYDGLKHRDAALEKEFEDEIDDSLPVSKALMWVVVGLVLLVGSAQLMVWGAVNIAQFFGISDLVIGLSVVAVGTSLPELGASIASVRKKEYDIALGNVLGSNIFNSLGVLGIAGAITPTAVDPLVLSRDMPFLFALMVVLFIVAGQWAFGRGRIGRVTGALFVLSFVAYQCLLFWQASGAA
ncbi:calcium/sodium antiporter [Granulosicoccaceae sp. 1_MG-2023]|nr:calcium/sodium antiporter [Granulosicoccaceae sp. 1_MG-2023]